MYRWHLSNYQNTIVDMKDARYCNLYLTLHHASSLYVKPKPYRQDSFQIFIFKFQEAYQDICNSNVWLDDIGNTHPHTHPRTPSHHHTHYTNTYLHTTTHTHPTPPHTHTPGCQSFHFRFNRKETTNVHRNRSFF